MRFLEQLFFRRPRILNQLHRLGIIGATSQTNEEELAALARYAVGARVALEIGTYQGVSAARIASALAIGGVLYCVDPWSEKEGRPDPCLQICRRHLKRSRTVDRIRILRGLSVQVESQVPNDLDFVFIDGDHSKLGLATDWKIVGPRLRPGSVVCLHDTVVPVDKPWRTFGSVAFFQEEIATDPTIETIEVVYSMTVLRKR